MDVALSQKVNAFSYLPTVDQHRSQRTLLSVYNSLPKFYEEHCHPVFFLFCLTYDTTEAPNVTAFSWNRMLIHITPGSLPLSALQLVTGKFLQFKRPFFFFCHLYLNITTITDANYLFIKVLWIHNFSHILQL